MCFIFKQECPDCQKYMRTGDFFHDKDTWDRFHNSGWHDGKSDWQPREEIKDMLDRMKKVWEKINKLKEPSEIDLRIIKAIGEFE